MTRQCPSCGGDCGGTVYSGCLRDRYRVLCAHFRTGMTNLDKNNCPYCKIAEQARKLNDMLCIIHRDGGQYIQNHGEAKAYDDACVKLHEWKVLSDDPEWREACEKQIEQQAVRIAELTAKNEALRQDAERRLKPLRTSSERIPPN